MPLYQVKCEKCGEFYELTMPLATFDRFNSGEETKECPECGGGLKTVICPVRLSSSRCCYGY
jgi:predicted nucleic acid-binding Zn ribbon protein